ALDLLGNTAAPVTYWGSSDSSGHYSPRTATLDAMGASGLYGGLHSTGTGINRGAMIAHIGGSFPASYTAGYATIDGLRFIGGSYQGVRIGSGSSGDGPTITNPVLLTNCEFTSFGFNAGDTVDNINQTWVDHNTNATTVTNNWYHDNVGHTLNNGDHFNAIIVWGFVGLCQGTTVTNNTCYHSGNIYGKENGISGTILRNNYLDVSNLTAGACIGIEDFTGNAATGLSATTYVQNNIVITAGGGVTDLDNLCGLSTLHVNPPTVGWQTPVVISNNTVICNSGNAILSVLQSNSGSNAVGAVQYWNNIYAGTIS